MSGRAVCRIGLPFLTSGAVVWEPSDQQRADEIKESRPGSVAPEAPSPNVWLLTTQSWLRYVEIGIDGQ